jgi:KDO2-lipid IV(A) lauroyltransferase
VHYDPGFGLEQYISAKTRGKGVLFLTAHVSAWELLPIAHAVLGHPLSFVVRPLDNVRLDQWATKIRSRFGNHVIRKQSSLRRILRLLRKNRDVGLLIDQNVQEKDGVFVPFFGTLACTAASPAALALRTGSPIVLGFMIPGERRGHYRIRFYPPIEVRPSPDRGADLFRYTSEFNQVLEKVIREFPHCWLWGHRRFRTRKDHRDPYA